MKAYRSVPELPSWRLLRLAEAPLGVAGGQWGPFTEQEARAGVAVVAIGLRVVIRHGGRWRRWHVDPLLLPSSHRTVEHGSGAVTGRCPAESGPDSFHVSPEISGFRLFMSIVGVRDRAPSQIFGADWIRSGSWVIWNHVALDYYSTYKSINILRFL